MKSEKSGEHLIVYLTGEIDHCSADALRVGIERLLQDRRIKRLTLDFSQVSFMDSSGIGMIIGRYKTMASRGGAIHARAMQPSVERLFHMAGLHRIITQEYAEDGEKHE